MELWRKLFGKKEETAQEMADRMNREFQERMEYEERTPVFEDGTPNPIFYQVEANRLNDLGRRDQADAILGEGIELCRRAGMDDAVKRLQKRLSGTR